MHTLLLAHLLSGIWKIVAATDAAQPPRTTAPAVYDHEKRADPTATITGGQASNWFPSAPSDAPKPTGSAFSLVAGDPSEGGLNIYVGEDLRKSLDSVLEEKCSDIRNDDCHREFQALFKKDEVDLQKRQFGLAIIVANLIRPVITGAVLGLVGGLLIGGGQNKKTPSNWRVPEENIRQMAPSATASALAIATATNDPKPLVITVPSDETPDESLLMKGESNGDYTINLDQDLARRLDDLIAINSHNCPQPTKRDMPSEIEKRADLPPQIVACLTAGMVVVLQNIYHGAVAEMARLRQQGRVAARPAQAGALAAMADAGRQVAQFQQPLALNDEDWRALQVGVFWEVYNREVARQHDGAVVRVKKEDQDQTDQKFCPPQDMLRCASENCKGEGGKCADDSVFFPKCECSDDAGCAKPESTPFCDNCGGDKGDSKCRGNDKGFWVDCACLPTEKNFKGFQFFDDKEEFDQTQQSLQGLPDLPDDPNPNQPHCELRKRDDDTVDVETKLFQSLVKNAVCKPFPYDITRSFDMTFTKDDASKNDGNWDRYEDYKFHFKWEDKPNVCIDTCETIYDSFTGSACSSDPNSMHAKGELELDCGKASFSIEKPAPAKPTSCSLKLTQIETCEGKFYANLWISADGKEVYHAGEPDSEPGVEFSTPTPLFVDPQNGMEGFKIWSDTTPQYLVNFVYGHYQWRSDTTDGPATCSLDGSDWNHDDLPINNCGPSPPTIERTFNCQYPCE